MTAPALLVYFDKGKPPRVVYPVAFWPGGVEQRVGGPRRPPPKPPKVQFAEVVGIDLVRKKPRQKAKKAPPVRDLPEVPPAPPDPAEIQERATSALRDYLRAFERGGYLAPWLRDGKRFRLVDAQDQAYARGDKTTQEVAGRLLALTGEQREAVRHAAGVSADIGRVKPEGGT